MTDSEAKEDDEYVAVLPGQLTQSDAESMRTTEGGSKGSQMHGSSSPKNELEQGNGDTPGRQSEIAEQKMGMPEEQDLPSLEQFLEKQRQAEAAHQATANGWVEKAPATHGAEIPPNVHLHQSGSIPSANGGDLLPGESYVEGWQGTAHSAGPSLWERLGKTMENGFKVLESIKSMRKSVTALAGKSILITEEKKQAREKLRKKPRARPKRVHFKLPRKRGITKGIHPVDPGSTYAERWLIFMVLPLAYELWAFPFRLAFGIPSDVGILLADIFCDFFILIDIILMFGITIPAYTYPDQPEDITNFRSIAAFRIKHDLPIRAIPAAAFYVVTGATWNAVGESEVNGVLWIWWSVGTLPRMLTRLQRLLNYFADIEKNLEVSVRSLQVIKFALIIFLSAHWVGCVFFFFSRLNGFSADTWVKEFEGVLPLYHAERSSRDLRYLLCVYKGFSAMVNLNYGLGLPRNITEMVWSMLTMGLQIYMNALILGTLLNFLVQKDPVQEAYKKKIEDLNVFMEAKQIPTELRERIYKHFQFQHQKNVQNKAAASVSLPRSLQIKVADAKYKYIIDKCTDKGRTLHGCNMQFISALLTRLQVMHVMAGEEITKRHEIARELYFVLDGAVHVVDEENRIKRAIRNDVPDMSPIVGEVPFFLGINHPHVIKARPDGSVQLLVLTKEASADVFSTYPEEFEIITSNLLQKFDLNEKGEEIAGTSGDREMDPDTMILKRNIMESMKQRRDRRFAQLLQSAANGDVEAVMMEARQGADINQKNYDGRTILHMAAEEGNYRMVEMLLEQGASKNAKDRWGQTPLAEAIMNRQSLVAGLLSQWHAELGMDNAASVLCQYAYEGNQEHIIRLVNNNTDPNLSDFDGRTAIHVGSAVGHHKIVEYLLTKKGDPNVEDRYGGTPLQDAVLNGQTLCATILRSYGGRLKREVGSREIRQAAKKGDVMRLRLLHDCGETIEVHDYDGRYPLHLASADARLLAVSYLLGVSADPNVEDRWGGKPLDDALRGWTLYHKYCAKLIHGWGGELGIMKGTEEGVRKLQELEEISLEQVRIVIKRLIANGHDKKPTPMLSESELWVASDASIQAVPWVAKLRASVDVACKELVERTQSFTEETNEITRSLIELTHALMIPSMKKGSMKNLGSPFTPKTPAQGSESPGSSLILQLTGGGRLHKEQSLAATLQSPIISGVILKEFLDRLHVIQRESDPDSFLRSSTAVEAPGWHAGEGGIDSEEEEQLHAEIDALLAAQEMALLAHSSPEEMAARQFQEAALHIVQFEQAFEALASACLEVREQELKEAGVSGHPPAGEGWNGRVTADGLGRLMQMLRVETAESAVMDHDAMYEEAYAFTLAFPLPRTRGPGARNWAKVRGGVRTIARMQAVKHDENSTSASAFRPTISLEALIAGSGLFRRALAGMNTDRRLCAVMETRIGRILGEERVRVLLKGAKDYSTKAGEVVFDALDTHHKALILISGEMAVEQNQSSKEEHSPGPKNSVLTGGDFIGVYAEFGTRKVPGLRITSSRVCATVQFKIDNLKLALHGKKELRRQLVAQAGEAPDQPEEDPQDKKEERTGLLKRIGDSARNLTRSASVKNVKNHAARKRRGSIGQALHNARNVFSRKHGSDKDQSNASPGVMVPETEKEWEVTESDRKWIQKMVESINAMWNLLSMGQQHVTRGQLLAIKQFLGEVSSECFRKLLAASQDGEGQQLPELIDQQFFWRCWVKFLSEQVYGEDVRVKKRRQSLKLNNLLEPGATDDDSQEGAKKTPQPEEEENEEETSTLLDKLHNRLDPGRWLKKRFFDEDVVENYEPAYVNVVGNLKSPLPEEKVPQFLLHVFLDFRFKITKYNVQEFFAVFLPNKREGAKSISWPDIRKTLRERRLGLVVGDDAKRVIIGTALNPSAPWMRWWFLLIKLAAVFHFLMVPWRASFLPWETMTHPHALSTDLVVDVITFINLIVMLNTAYNNSRSMWVTRRSKIINKVHLPSAFAAVPMDWFAWLCGASNEACCWLRLNKMLLMLNWGEKGWVGFNFVRAKTKSKRAAIYKMIASVLMVLHISACFWFFLGARYGAWFPSRSVSWLQIEGNLEEELVGVGITYDREEHFALSESATTVQQYVLSLYWVSATLTVNGLVGDVVPQNWIEVLFTIVMMALNMTLIRWVVGEVSTIVMSAGRGLAEARQELEAVDRFASGSNLPEDLQKEIKLHYRASNAQGGIKTIDQESLLKGMSHSLKVEVASFISREYLDGVDLFAGCSERLLDAVSVLLLEVSFAPEEYLFRTSGAAREMYFVVNGCIEELSGIEEEDVDAVKRAHSSVGGIAFFFGLRHLHSARASKLSGATCLRLVRDHFFELLKIYPQDEEIIGNNAMASLEVVQSRADSSRRLGSVRGTHSEVSAGAGESHDAKAGEGDDQIVRTESAEKADHHEENHKEPEEHDIHTISGKDDGTELSDGLEALVGSSMKDKITALKNRRRKQRISLLMSACHECDESKVASIITGDLSVNSCDGNKRTPLHIAASEGHMSLVKMLLDMRADVNLKDKFQNSPFNDAVRHHHDQVVKYMRETVPGTRMLLPGFKAAVLMCDAAYSGDLAHIKRLVENGVQINDANYDGRTALHLAACQGHVEVCEYLLESKASPGVRDRFDSTPLCDALRVGNEDVQRLLRQHGDHLGDGFGDRFTRKVNGAAWAGDLQRIKTMIDNGVDPEEGDHRRRTALHLAACREKISVLEYLLDMTEPKSFDINRVDRYGNTALDDAIRENSTTSVALLIKRGGLHKGDGEKWAKLAEEQDSARQQLLKGSRQQKVAEVTSFCPERRATEAVDQHLLPGLRVTGQALFSAMSELANRVARATPLFVPHSNSPLPTAERRLLSIRSGESLGSSSHEHAQVAAARERFLGEADRDTSEAEKLENSLSGEPTDKEDAAAKDDAAGKEVAPVGKDLSVDRLASPRVSPQPRTSLFLSNMSDIYQSNMLSQYSSVQEAAEHVLEQVIKVRRLIGDMWRLIEFGAGCEGIDCIMWTKMHAKYEHECLGPGRQLRRAGEVAKMTGKVMKEIIKATKKSERRRNSMVLGFGT